MAHISGMLRAAAVSPRVHLANPAKNAQEIAQYLRAADEMGISLCVFPELCLTGATCGDLFYQEALLEGAKEALKTLCELDAKTAFVVGLPLEMGGQLYNCAAVCAQGNLALVTKAFPADRWFAPGKNAPDWTYLEEIETPVLCGDEAVIRAGGMTFGVCIGQELSSPLSPAARQCAAGAMLIANPCAETESGLMAKARRQRLSFLSDQLACAIVHAGAGYGESTTDAVYAGYTGIYEAGDCLAQRPCFEREGTMICADTDCARLGYKRRTTALYAPCDQRTIVFEMAMDDAPKADEAILRPLDKAPFIPEKAEADTRYADILAIQAQGLIRRMDHIGVRKLVIGVSGGLDSTLALLVAAHAYDLMGWARSDIIAITMPGLGTSKRTHDNAESLSDLLGCTALEIPIGPAVAQHFADIGQDPAVRDICYENSQARERTQILMDYANKVGGIVLGTGDLSELALGFCTYNGDQMSMYNVNGSIPKTLMRPLVRWVSAKLGDKVHDVVVDIVKTPVSPELVLGEEEISQKTEDILGSYDLHDFFLWNMMDSGAGPKKLYALAVQAFGGYFTAQTIYKALDTFVRRFFSQQFKRSAMPDGAGATGISLSPRGGFACPSDAQRALWMSELEGIKE